MVKRTNGNVGKDTILNLESVHRFSKELIANPQIFYDDAGASLSDDHQPKHGFTIHLCVKHEIEYQRSPEHDEIIYI
jgi:hypothetical protein